MSNLKKHTKSIRSWSDEDKPREKLRTKGISSLSDTELLAIILGSGNRNKSAVDLAREMLAAKGNILSEFADQELKDLLKFTGVGEAKAISILAAIELGRRACQGHRLDRPVITSSKQAFEFVSRNLGVQSHEECWVLYLNQASKVVSKTRLSVGGLSATIVDIRIILKGALDNLATGIILCHNHPSGNLKPSEADRQITKKLLEAGRLVDIKLIDHLIVTQTGYYSFADTGEIL